MEKRAITVTPAEREAELAYIVHMTRLVGVPLASRFGVVEGSSAAGGVPRGGTLRVQPRSDRFVRVPASAGFSHWSWTLPDRKGHRMLVAARSVSRYEQLLRWWLNLHTRFDLAEEVALKRSGADETIYTVQAHTADSVTLDDPLEPNTGWQPLRIEVVAGTGVGQRREVVEISDDRETLSIDPGDPWQPALVASSSKVKVLDAAPGWRLVTLDAIHDPARGEGARPLMVYQYPHSRRPRFSYQIPLDGMRATYNQISRVRTGYHGIEATFRYFLPNRIDGGDAPTLDDLLAGIVADVGATVTPPDRTVIAVKSGAEPAVRLFRHERLVSLPGLPFFYRYRLDVRSAYKARRLESDRATAADRLPDDENASPPARRLPACLGLHDVQAIHQSVPVMSGTLPSGQPPERTKIRVVASGGDPLPNQGLLFRARPSGDEWRKRVVVTNWEDGVISLSKPYPDKDVPSGEDLEGWDYELTPHEYEVTLLASANRDHLTREESASEPKPVKVPLPDSPIADETVAARDLPDFFMEYQLAIRQPGELGDDLPSRKDLFISAGFIRLPWSPGFRPPLGFSPALPLVSLSSGLTGRRGYAVVPASACADIAAFKAAAEAQLGDTWESASTFEIRPLGADQSFQFKRTTADLLHGARRGWQNARDASVGVSELDVAARPGLIAVLARADGMVSSMQEFSVPLERVTSGSTEYWRLRFRVALGRGRSAVDSPDSFFVQGRRDGQITRPRAVVGD